MSTSISSSKDLTLSETRNESKPTARHAVSRTPVQVRPVRDWTARTALPIAVVAVGLAGWALFDVRSGTADAPSPPDSTARVCGAFQVVSTAIPLQTHLDLGEDPVAQTAVAGNARLALLGGGQYLLGTLDAGTPEDLATAVRSFANSLQDIVIHALAGVPNTDPIQSGRMADSDAVRRQIVELCQ